MTNKRHIMAEIIEKTRNWVEEPFDDIKKWKENEGIKAAKQKNRYPQYSCFA